MRRSIVALVSAAAVVSVSLTAGSAAQAIPRMSPSTLTKCGFSVQPNLDFWYGGTASLAPTGKVPAGRNIIIQGRAAQGVKDGTRLELVRFNPAGKGCHGSLDRIGSGIFTTVKGGQYYLNFQLDRQGSFGYAVQGISGGATYEIEFQITTR
ncbi:MAG: hypothetical protein RL347_255 [Actinomycetota bacterium]|jgi:hypothetical protein